MTTDAHDERVNSEWVALNAFRELLKLSTKGSVAKSTYDEALEFGGDLYPALLGHETSLLRRAKESDTARLYRQRARLKGQAEGRSIHPMELIDPEIEELEQLLAHAKATKDKGQVDQLKNRLKTLRSTKDEIAPGPHSENQLIMRDTAAFPLGLPGMETGKGYRSFRLPDGHSLRVHLLHPDKPEHVSGADVLYERHQEGSDVASLVFVQYKIWEKQTLALTDPRLHKQLTKLKAIACDSGLCTHESDGAPYRFPHCAAFLRPTDKLQHANQKLISSGEHLPICRIQECTKINRFGTPVLEYKSIRSTSLSGEAFEYMFTYDKLGSRPVQYGQLGDLYEKLRISADPDHLVIHAQELYPQH